MQKRPTSSVSTGGASSRITASDHDWHLCTDRVTQVLDEDVEYCRWLSQIDSPAAGLARFKAYVATPGKLPAKKLAQMTVPSGKHAQKTFEDVLREDRGYLEWILSLSDIQAGWMRELKEFALEKGVKSKNTPPNSASKPPQQYGEAVGPGSVPSGKHKGKSFEDVLREDPGYVQWVVGLDDIKAPWMQELKTFALAKGIKSRR